MFVEKIVDQNRCLEKYFPDYNTYNLPVKIPKCYEVPQENPKVLKAKMFILEQFLNITRIETSLPNQANKPDKLLIPYFTCALDINEMKRALLSSVCEKILRNENSIKHD